MKARATEPTNLLCKILTTTDVPYGGYAPFGTATTTCSVVLLVVALSTVVGLLCPASPAFAQEQTFPTFEDSTAPAATTAEPETTAPPDVPATVPSAAQYQYSDSEATPSATQYQYSAAPGGRLMDTGGIGLIALLIGGAAAVTAFFVLWAGGERGDQPAQQRGGQND